MRTSRKSAVNPESEFRLSIDATALANPQRTGIGRVLESLLPELNDLASPRVRIRLFAGGAIRGPVTDLIRQQSNWDAETRSWPSLHMWQQFGMGRAIRRFAPAVHLAPDGLLPLGLTCPSVGIVHDLLWLRHPETCKRHIRAVFRWRLPPSLHHHTVVHFDSAFTQGESEEVFPRIPSLRRRVTHLGVCSRTFRAAEESDQENLENFQRRRGLERPYILSVGNIRRHKNLSVLIRSMNELRASGHPPPQLVIVGAGKLEGELADLGKAVAPDQIRALGYLNEDELRLAYQGARIFVFPSRYEGFGLPLLEAMSCGTPVLYAQTSALPEIAGKAGLAFQPDDGNTLASLVNRLIRDDDLHREMAEEGLRRARDFSWRATAEAVWDSLLIAAEGNG